MHFPAHIKPKNIVVPDIVNVIYASVIYSIIHKFIISCPKILNFYNATFPHTIVKLENKSKKSIPINLGMLNGINTVVV